MKFELHDFYAAIRKEQDPENMTDDVSSNTAHYLKVFEKGSLINWNWVACLFSPIWMLYRRMYATYILLMTSSFALSYLPTGVLVLGLFINIGIGMFGDSIYIYFVRQGHARNQKMNPGNIPLLVLVCIHIIVVGVFYQVQSYLEPENIEIFNDM